MLDFHALGDSAGSRTHVALHATYLRLADDELRSQVRARSRSLNGTPSRASPRTG
jgi:hypothetical protein